MSFDNGEAFPIIDGSVYGQPWLISNFFGAKTSNKPFVWKAVFPLYAFLHNCMLPSIMIGFPAYMVLAALLGTRKLLAVNFLIPVIGEQTFLSYGVNLPLPMQFSNRFAGWSEHGSNMVDSRYEP